MRDSVVRLQPSPDGAVGSVSGEQSFPTATNGPAHAEQDDLRPGFAVEDALSARVDAEDPPPREAFCAGAVFESGRSVLNGEAPNRGDRVLRYGHAVTVAPRAIQGEMSVLSMP